MGKAILFGMLAVMVTATAALAVLGGGDFVIPVEGARGALFSHEFHVGKAKLGCKECHYKIYTNRVNHRKHTMEQLRTGESCGVCHNGKRAFSVATKESCDRCHNQ